MEAGDLVLHFLRSIGRPKEAEHYLRHYRSESAFAIIAMTDAIMEQAQNAFIADLRLLCRLDLIPIIVFVMDEHASATNQAKEIYERTKDLLPTRIVDLHNTQAATDAGEIPLVPLTDTNWYAALAHLAVQRKTHKIVFLNSLSGLQPQGGPVQSIVDITVDYEPLMENGVLSPAQQGLLCHSKELLENVPQQMTIAITSPFDVIRELFTVRGAGTLIRRGSTIHRYTSLNEVNTEKIQELMERSFGKGLCPHFFDQSPHEIFVADEYRGVAILMDTELGPYLSKFAVDVDARGEGIGRDLWRALNQNSASLFWRARPKNPISSWYEEQCDGLLRTENWQIFWRGLAPEKIPHIVKYVNQNAVDFKENY